MRLDLIFRPKIWENFYTVVKKAYCFRFISET